MSENPAHQHGQGHQHDRGWRGVARYLRYFGSMWMSPVNREVIRLLDIRPAEQVLDIGAGMGPGAVLAAKAGARVFAVDPTPFMRFVLGVRRLWQLSRDRLEVLDGAAEQLPVPDASVDAAWAVNAMHHWSNLDDGIGELARVLRPGGRLVLVDEDFDDPSHQDHKRFTAQRCSHDLGFADVDPAEVGSKLAAAGFVVDEAGKALVAGQPAKLLRATKP
jgi:ubiquinone/menaquinone biosynthesis C-methylase UbiE